MTGSPLHAADTQPRRLVAYGDDLQARAHPRPLPEPDRGEVRELAQQQERLAVLGQLAAGIAHDLNNMLTTIIAYAELIDDSPDTPDSARHGLDHIITGGERAAELVRQILNFGRRTPLEHKEIELVALLKDAVSLLGRTLPESIRVEADYGKGQCVVEGNATLLLQAIVNLAINARDAMPGGGEVRLRLSPLRLEPGQALPMRHTDSQIASDSRAQDWAVVTVSDTGTGMSPEVLSRVFEPFYTTKRSGEGTGLGLSQVDGIVKQHGGHMDVRTGLGRGSRFILYLPLCRAAGCRPPDKEEALPTGTGETVLVVEDERDVLAAAGTMLEALNYRVLTAPNGQRARAVYRMHQDEIEVVLTDVVMPEMGGLDLFRALKARNPGVPVVAMTGYAAGDSETTVHDGFAGWVRKPLRMARLARAMSDALKHRAA